MYEIVLSDIILCKTPNCHDALIKYLDLVKKIIQIDSKNSNLINHFYVRYRDEHLFMNKNKYYYDTKTFTLKTVNLYTNKVVQYNNIDEILNIKLKDLNIKKTKPKQINKPSKIEVLLNTTTDKKELNLQSKLKSESDYVDIDKIDIESLDEETYKQLEQQLQLLNEKRDEHKQSLNELKQIYEKDNENYIEYKSNIDNENTQQYILKQKEEEQKRIFTSERDYTYQKIKQSIANDNLKEDDISPLFVKKYTIFKFMDENNTLNNEDSHEIFYSLLDNLNNNKEPATETTKEGYVPHNYNYLDEGEKKKYENIKNTDILEEIVNKSAYESLESIEKKLDKMEDSL